jgi:hypothetical protein
MGDVLHDARDRREGYSDWHAGALLSRGKSFALTSGPFFAAAFLSLPAPTRTSADLYQALHGISYPAKQPPHGPASTCCEEISAEPASAKPDAPQWGS